MGKTNTHPSKTLVANAAAAAAAAAGASLADAPGNACDPEEALDHVNAITIVLDDHYECTFTVDGELAIPDDFDDVLRAARRAPAKAAFWDGQAERMLMFLRSAEADQKALEGRMNEFLRDRLEGVREGELVAEAAVQAAVDAHKAVLAGRKELAVTRMNYGLCRAMRDNMVRRASVLNRLVDRTAGAKSEPGGGAGHLDEP